MLPLFNAVNEPAIKCLRHKYSIFFLFKLIRIILVETPCTSLTVKVLFRCLELLPSPPDFLRGLSGGLYIQTMYNSISYRCQTYAVGK